jgi:hypothetical protein
MATPCSRPLRTLSASASTGDRDAERRA